MDNKILAKTFDQSILRPDSISENEIKKFCADAVSYGFRGIVVHPCNVNLVKTLLKGSDVLTVSVCDFPHGKGLIKSRAKDIKEILKLGADEIDIVANYQYLIDDNYREFKKDLKTCAKAIEDKVLKIILEVDYLSERLIKTATEAVCKIANEENVKLIIKTKTGFAEPRMLNNDAVRVIKKTLEINNMYGDKIKIKASGGIRTKEEAISILQNGAHILGVGKGKELIES